VLNFLFGLDKIKIALKTDPAFSPLKNKKIPPNNTKMFSKTKTKIPLGVLFCIIWGDFCFF
jgi:hypothetical protein